MNVNKSFPSKIKLEVFQESKFGNNLVKTEFRNDKCLEEKGNSEHTTSSQMSAEAPFANRKKQTSVQRRVNKKSFEKIEMIDYKDDFSSAAELVAASVATSAEFAPVSSQSSGSLLRCSNCDFEAEGLLLLRKHIIQNHSAKVYRCSDCEYIATSEQSLKNHSLIHSVDCNPFKCEGCGFKTNSQGSLLDHVKTHKHACSECIFGTEKMEDFELHRKVHANILFKCSHCDFTTNENVKYELHLSLHKLNVESSNNRMRVCNNCGFKTRYEKLYKKHLLNHVGKAKFYCNQCSYSSQRKHGLMRHLRSHLNVKLFKCSDCKYETNRKEYLLNHTMKHFTEQKLFHCSKCNYGTNWKHCLGRHQNCHIASLQCHICNFETPNRNHLDEHLLLKHGLFLDKDDNIIKRAYNLIFPKNKGVAGAKKHIILKNSDIKATLSYSK